ncbi:MAG TPA: VOC family protein [Chloroflexota bacterium]
MAVPFQVTFDCADPDRQAKFWAQVLGYVEQPPPEGYEDWPAFLQERGIPEEEWNSASAIVDPDGRGSRIYFQRVPETKTVKNRVHLDVSVGAGMQGTERRQRVNQEADRVVTLGAVKLRVADEQGGYWIVMQDPEGNEFCLQ